MSIALKILLETKQAKNDEMSKLRAEIKEITAAIKILESDDGEVPVSSGNEPSTINPAIIEAVSTGRTTPSEIYAYLNISGIETTKNSISTRLSKMKADGLVENTGEGWTLPNRKKASDASTSEANSNRGETVGQGIPKSPPEGSSPSHSTSSSQSTSGHEFSRDMDDEIPF